MMSGYRARVDLIWPIYCFPFPASMQILFPNGHWLLLSTEHFINYLSCDCIAVTGADLGFFERGAKLDRDIGN